MPPQGAAEAPAWIVALAPWLLVVLTLAVLGVLVGIGSSVARLRALEALGQRLDVLEEIRHALARLVSDRGDLDLRRVEHVLLELRDGQKRLEDALLARVGATRDLAGPESLPAAAASSLSERVTNRLLALGYERVRLVTPLAELETLSSAGGQGSGEVVVEALRDGVPCKGRVLLRRGALTDVEIQPAYKLFP